jgi:hypothetical protein
MSWRRKQKSPAAAANLDNLAKHRYRLWTVGRVFRGADACKIWFVSGANANWAPWRLYCRACGDAEEGHFALLGSVADVVGTDP